MNIPNYDAWKLASPDEEDLCRFCDEDRIDDLIESESNERMIEHRKMIHPLRDQYITLVENLTRGSYDLRKMKEDMITEMNEYFEIMEESYQDILTTRVRSEITDSISLCRSCHDEDHADDDRDDR